MRDADTGSSGGLTLDMIWHASPQSLRDAASALTAGAGDLDTERSTFLGTIVQPLRSGFAWSGAGQDEAGNTMAEHSSAFSGVIRRIDPAARTLNGLADLLDGAQRQLTRFWDEISDLRVEVDQFGNVTLLDDETENDAEHKARELLAKKLEAELHVLLESTATADELAAGTLSKLLNGDLTKPPAPLGLALNFWDNDFGKAAFWLGIAGTLLPHVPGIIRLGSERSRALARALGRYYPKIDDPRLAGAVRRSLNGLDDTASYLKRVASHLDWLKHGPALSNGKRVVAKIPYVGWVAIGAGVVDDLRNGDSVQDALAKNLSPELAGLVAAGALGAAGAPVVVVVGGSIVVAYGVGYAIEHPEQVREAIDISRGLGDALGDRLRGGGAVVRNGVVVLGGELGDVIKDGAHGLRHGLDAGTDKLGEYGRWTRDKGIDLLDDAVATLPGH